MTNHNKVVVDIIGAGAIGLLYAAKLKLAGYYIRVWCNTVEQANRIGKQGITFNPLVDGGRSSVVFFDEVNSLYELDDLVKMRAQSLFTLVAVKQTGLSVSFLEQLAFFTEQIGKSTLVCIQNGIGHIEKLKENVLSVTVVQAVTSEAARKVGDEVQHTGHGTTQLAYQENIENNLNFIVKCLINAGIECFMSKGIEGAVYNKLIVNAVINPLTALFRIRNGLLPQHPAQLSLMQLLFDESKAIIEQANSIQLSITFDEILHICEKTALNHSSMFSDILHHRVTEIEAINGALVQLAEKHQLSASINKTVYLLVLAQHP